MRIDIVTSIDGLTFEEAWKNRVAGTYGDRETYFISGLILLRIRKPPAARRTWPTQKSLKHSNNCLIPLSEK